MLHLQYECHRADLKLPWDKVVERLSTGSSGASALQHLNKLRDILITEGHMVPPLLGKRSVPQDVTIRGFIRDMDADKPTDTKVVRWGEHVEDRKENLEIDGVVRGSGNYRRGTYKALEKNQQASGERRNRLPVELRETPAGSNGTLDTHQKKVSKRRYSRAVSSCLASPEPAGLASDEEYNPTFNEKASFGRSLRKSAKPIGKYKVESSGDEAEHEANDWQEDAFRNIIAFNTPRSKRLMGHDQGEEGLMTPPATKQSKVMKFKVNPCFLLKLDRESIVPKKFDDEDAGLDHELEQFDDDIEDGIENSDYDIDDPKGSQIFGEYQTPTSQPHQLNVGQPFQENLQETGYPGIVPKVEAPMYNLPARCGYTSTYQSHVLPLVHPFATSAARTFSEIHTDNISTVAKTINDHSFDGMFNIIGGSRDESVGFCVGNPMAGRLFYRNTDVLNRALSSWWLIPSMMASILMALAHPVLACFRRPSHHTQHQACPRCPLITTSIWVSRIKATSIVTTPSPLMHPLLSNLACRVLRKTLPPEPSRLTIPNSMTLLLPLHCPIQAPMHATCATISRRMWKSPSSSRAWPSSSSCGSALPKSSFL